MPADERAHLVRDSACYSPPSAPQPDAHAPDRLSSVGADALAPPEPGWQPIETMPQEPCLIAWSEQQSTMSIGGRRVEMIAGRQEYEEIVGYGEPPATHWMPLPAAPKETR